jgi:hypothetical protein
MLCSRDEADLTVFAERRLEPDHADDLGNLPLQLGAGVRYWAESQDNGPEGFGTRLVLTFLFPK